MRFRLALILSTVLTVTTGCGAYAPIPPLTPIASAVVVQKGDPPVGATEVGHVTASHGSCCGAIGQKGSYEGAYADIKNRAAALGANFVRIDIVEFPHMIGIGWNNTYVLHGVAFKTK